MAEQEVQTSSKPEEVEVAENTESIEVLRGRKPSAKRLPRIDSLHLEAGKVSNFHGHGAKISFTFALFPAVMLAYAGQAAYLSKFPENVAETFYKSIPGPLFWPTFVVAVAAAIIASQAVIACVFSIISQAQTLGCFPRVKVVHTSAKYEGQVYIPELNMALMLAWNWGAAKLYETTVTFLSS